MSRQKKPATRYRAIVLVPSLGQKTVYVYATTLRKASENESLSRLGAVLSLDKDETDWHPKVLMDVAPAAARKTEKE